MNLYRNSLNLGGEFKD